MAEKISIGKSVSFVKRVDGKEKTVYGIVTAFAGRDTVYIKEIVGSDKVWFHAVDLKDIKIIQGQCKDERN
jgi:hypothetical protein